MNNALDNEAYLNQERSLRLDLLREYTKLQTLDVLLWDIFGNANKSHLQRALRVLTHFIEDASCEEIVEAIDKYKAALKSEGWC